MHPPNILLSLMLCWEANQGLNPVAATCRQTSDNNFSLGIACISKFGSPKPISPKTVAGLCLNPSFTTTGYAGLGFFSEKTAEGFADSRVGSILCEMGPVTPQGRHGGR